MATGIKGAKLVSKKSVDDVRQALTGALTDVFPAGREGSIPVGIAGNKAELKRLVIIISIVDTLAEYNAAKAITAGRDDNSRIYFTDGAQGWIAHWISAENRWQEYTYAPASNYSAVMTYPQMFHNPTTGKTFLSDGKSVRRIF